MTAMIGPLVIWKNRCCVVLPDGCWALSRVGHWQDFDYASEEAGADRAVAGRVTTYPIESDARREDRERTIRVCPLDDDRLLLIQASGELWELIDDPGKGGCCVAIDIAGSEASQWASYRRPGKAQNAMAPTPKHLRRYFFVRPVQDPD